MSKVQRLRASVKQRLTAAADEIFGLFERAVAEYEEELCRSKEENEKQRKLPDAVFSPQLRLHRTNVQKQLMNKGEPPGEQQEPEPPPQVKEGEEELWSGEEGEQLQGLEEADITRFPFTAAPVKSDDDDEKPESSQLHQSQTEELTSSYDSLPYCLEPQTKLINGDWTQMREPQSGINVLKKNKCSSNEKPFGCSVRGKVFNHNLYLKRHMRIHTGERPFRCCVCGKTFGQTGHLQSHSRRHTGEKPFSCRVCEKRFTWLNRLKKHKCVGGVSLLHQNREAERTEPDQDQSGS
ncbi:hypothetical protein Q5P01_018890 [Channa striata]|uniref:C2H2-type domain-containing protein n=1 Tax=Channa striata TaxID=64152 RepID=A0AA88M5Q3_CHASR|nr:hypothetical protein Q5P01_018890 [Channa striata]